MGEIKITEKSTKAQILEAYNQALKELEALKAMNDSPIETAKNEALRASLKNAETAAKNSVFSEEIIKQYKDLKIAIDEYKKELESLYGIKTEADSLAAIINAHKFKIADMDTEYKKLKDEQDSKLAKRKAEVDEEIEELENKLSKAKSKADKEAEEYEEELKKKKRSFSLYIN